MIPQNPRDFFSSLPITPGNTLRTRWVLLTLPFLLFFSSTLGCYQNTPAPDPKKAIDLLISLLDDRDTLVRRNAAEALGKIGSHQSQSALRNKLDDSEPVVREAAARSLGWLSVLDSETRFKLAILLDDVDSSVRQAASQALSRN
ncbi:MAG: HEAT repeat domain-containing protein [Nitrospira sp.]